MAEKYMMVSLDNEAKPLAQVLSNDKAMQILKYVTDNDKCTETQISEALNIPISTVHYNLQNLVKVKLVKPNEFHYSEKGKEVYHYSVANKIIVIAPSKEKKIAFLKKLLGSFLTVGIFAGLWRLFFVHNGNLKGGVMTGVKSFSEASVVATKPVLNPIVLLLLGAVAGIIVFGIWESVLEKFK